MVKHKNGKGPGTRDVDFDTRMKLVVEMKLFRRGKSKHRTVAALAKAIAGVKPAAAYRFVSQYDAGGAASLQSRRAGNTNATKFSPEMASKVKSFITENREHNSRELAASVGVHHTTALDYRRALGYKAQELSLKHSWVWL